MEGGVREAVEGERGFQKALTEASEGVGSEAGWKAADNRGVERAVVEGMQEGEGVEAVGTAAGVVGRGREGEESKAMA